ncbi:MAG TPA: prepilin-type N-terminal cleavage/methylation domain-containing protein [Pyrinomonadaceae bacterium]|nr:prepilin-type N-terminal cleavage/methylation domain-containing protein [Pyrinomonadaceae bacterium]
MQTPNSGASKAAGFSLLELLIAMTVTLVLMGVASTLLASSLNVRTRENQRTAAIADAQRALNNMTREISNSGFGLSGNGIVASDSSTTSIRVRANLNATLGETTSNAASDRDEDVRYLLYSDTTNSYIVRLDVNTSAQEMILANRVDALAIHYYSDKVYYTSANCDISNVTDAAGTSVSEVAQKSSAKYIVISLCVTLPQVSSPGSPGFQPASRVQLTSDVTLNNSDLTNF